MNLDDPELLGLLEDVLDRPGDDTPRLVLADWLEEYGDGADVVRAQFIRTGAMREGCPRASWFGTWFHPADAAVTKDGVTVRGREAFHCLWRRGFVEGLGCRLADLVRRGGLIFAEHPVTLVTIADQEARLPAYRRPPSGVEFTRRAVEQCVVAAVAYGGGTDAAALEWRMGAAERLAAHIAGATEGKVYLAAADALPDLSRACVAFGREESLPIREARRRGAA